MFPTTMSPEVATYLIGWVDAILWVINLNTENSGCESMVFRVFNSNAIMYAPLDKER